MNKVVNRYRFLLGIIILFLLITVIINLTYQIKIDKFMVTSTRFTKHEDEFEQARKNAFINFKNSLLDQNIILDNIQYGENDTIKFDINQHMYINQINDFLQFINNVPNLNIGKINITKHNLYYNLNISAEI